MLPSNELESFQKQTPDLDKIVDILESDIATPAAEVFGNTQGDEDYEPTDIFGPKETELAEQVIDIIKDSQPQNTTTLQQALTEMGGKSREEIVEDIQIATGGQPGAELDQIGTHSGIV